MVAKHVHSSQIIADPHNILTFSFCFMSAISAREGIRYIQEKVYTVSV